MNATKERERQKKMQKIGKSMFTKKRRRLRYSVLAIAINYMQMISPDISKPASVFRPRPLEILEALANRIELKDRRGTPYIVLACPVIALSIIEPPSYSGIIFTDIHH